MTDVPWKKPEDFIEQVTIVKQPSGAMPGPVKAIEQPPIEESEGEEQKQLMDTGITFFKERLMLETSSQETLDAFKAAYHKLERHYLGDYGE